MVTLHLRRLLGLAACAWLLPLAAAPVTYTFHTVASGSLAGVPFAHKTLTFRMSGDTGGVQWAAGQQVARNPATTAAIALDDHDLGPVQQPLGVSNRCLSTPYTFGIDFMTTVLPALSPAIDGVFDIAPTTWCGLEFSLGLETAASALGSPMGIATGIGTLIVEKVDSLAFESFVMAPASIRMRVVHNPYGDLHVAGGSFDGTTITSNGGDIVIDLGPQVPGGDDFLMLQYDELTIGAHDELTFRAGAPGQKVVLAPPLYWSPRLRVQGTLAAIAWQGAPAPALTLNAPAVEVAEQGLIQAPSGLRMAFPVNFGWIDNRGTIDGGSRLTINMSAVVGGGRYLADVFDFRVPGGVNHPVAGRFYLANGLHVGGSTRNEVEIVPHTSSSSGAPTFLNLLIEGDGLLWMPSAWPPAPDPAATFPANDAPVLPGGMRQAGVADPMYGGGSMIVQSTGSLRLENGGTGDFVFPGAIVLKAAGTLDLNGLAIVQGWTTSGKAFQGAFFESPDIVSSAGAVSVYTNDLNWVNFSSLPRMPVRAYTLVRDAGGSASYRSADGIAPHFNTYSTLIDAAANDACWTCLVDTRAFDLSAP